MLVRRGIRDMVDMKQLSGRFSNFSIIDKQCYCVLNNYSRFDECTAVTLKGSKAA